MSYQVLARKYRPRNFDELVGQDVVARALSHALTTGRVHHAYLFTGTRGVGKTTLARIMARCLNCDSGPTATPCGVCSACVDIAEGRFVDLLEIDAASHTGVDNVRELIENAQYLPTQGRYKLYLIDEVHMLSKAAFNALLKTLEEPPPHVKFILATTDPQKLPITILSRCLQFALKPMTAERIVNHLTRLLTLEQVPAEESALWLLARAAQGSMRDALSLTDQAIAFGQGQLRDDTVRALLGSVDRTRLSQLLTHVAAGEGSDVLAVIEAMAEQSIDFTQALIDLLSMLHRVALAQAVPEALDNAEGDRADILSLAQQLSPENVQLFYQIAIQSRRDMPLAPDARSGFEMMALRLLSFRLVDEPSALPAVAVRPTPVVREPVASAPMPEPEPESEPEPEPEPIQKSEPVALVAPTMHSVDWTLWVSRSGLAGAALNLARHAVLAIFSPDQAVIHVSPKHQMLAGGQALPQLQARWLQEFPGCPLQLQLIEPQNETPAQSIERQQRERHQAAEQALQQDPLVQAVMTTFGATPLPDSLVLSPRESS